MEEKEFLALFDITLNDNIIVKAKDKKDAIIKVREILNEKLKGIGRGIPKIEIIDYN